MLTKLLRIIGETLISILIVPVAFVICLIVAIIIYAELVFSVPAIVHRGIFKHAKDD